MMIPYGRQHITRRDINEVVAVLKSDFLTQGPQVERFESSIAKYCGCRHVVAVNSATSALHIACLALGLGPGDLLWTSAITFVASANCGLYCGANVDFIDIDPETFNLSTIKLEEKLQAAERLGRLPKILVTVHFTGQPCDMSQIHALSQRYGFRIIEDASHAIGAEFQSERIGSCKYSDITIFSFHPVKIITSGEGGCATTNDKALARKMMLLRSHGITRETDQMTQEPDGPWFYEQVMLGFNYRITDLQAALGASQIERLNTYIERRHKIVKIYNNALQDCPVKLHFQKSDRRSSYHLYIIRVDLQRLHISKKELFERLRTKGIGTNVHYIPVPNHYYFKQLGHRLSNFPEATKFYHEALSLPMYPTLTASQTNYIIDALRSELIK
jgi:UDP-4-amino-4,6-dideoxy-N-acetyl-beta-L-altrosamine transaminase